MGQYIAYPPAPRDDLLEPSTDGYVGYRARLGDNYLHLAFALGLDRDALRAQNDLWHLQTLPAGQELKLPLAWTGKYDDYTVRSGDTLGTIAEAMDSTPGESSGITACSGMTRSLQELCFASGPKNPNRRS